MTMTSPGTSNSRTGELDRSENRRIEQDLTSHTGTLPDVGILLSRLDRVRQFSTGWSARCPAHEDRQASLSIAFGNDGRILVHDFAGCHITDVLGAVGLTTADLFPARSRGDLPDSRRALRESARQAQWRAALGVLSREATVVSIAARAVLRGRMTNADAQRVTVALERIDAARTVLR